MNIKTLYILVACLLIGAGAYYFTSLDTSINAADKIGTSFAPELLGSLNNVSKVEITGPNNQVLSTLIKSNDTWLVKEKNQYPADISKIRTSLLAIAEAKIMEQKTSNPDLYSKLGVEDVSSESAQGVKVHLEYDGNVSNIVIGKPGPQINKTRYVRNEDSNTSWLIDRKIDLNHDAAYWLRKDIFSVEPDEVLEVIISLADGSRLEIKNTNQEENSFEVTNLTDPESQVVDAELHQVTNALSSFQLLDVVTDTSVIGDDNKTMDVSYHLKNGILINLTGYEIEQDNFVAIDVKESSKDGMNIDDQVKEEVSRLQDITAGWIYKIPNVTYDSIHKSEPDVLAITEDQLN